MSEDREFEFSIFDEEQSTFNPNAPRKKKETVQNKSSVTPPTKTQPKKEYVKPKEKKKKITQPKKKKEKKSYIAKTPKKKEVKKTEVKKKEVTSEDPWPRPHARRLDRKGKIIANIDKQLEKNLNHKGRFTAPKKRNILSRLILQKRLEYDGFFDIEADYQYLTQEEVDKSKFAKNNKDKRLFRQVQAYEDARDDDKIRKGILGFKIGLAVIMLATMLGVTATVANSFKDALSPNSIVSMESMNKDEKQAYIEMINSFVLEIQEKDGYEFDYLSDEEIQDAYLKIKNREKNMNENQYRAAWQGFRDQEFLDKIVKNSLGEEMYNGLSPEKQRDCRQLAFEILPKAQLDIFGKSNPYIRNPIVYDELQAKNAAKDKGYKTELIVNSDREETVRHFGRIIHLIHMLDEEDYESAGRINNGQDLLNGILMQASGEAYNELSKRDKRDYIQLIYELLPEDARTEHIKDPIIIDKEAELEK